MIQEFRIYKLHPGKLKAFKRRFREVSVPRFKLHGIRLRGFWEIGKFCEQTPQVSAGGVVLPAFGAEFGQDDVAYLVEFDSVEERDAAWQAWVLDPEWLEAKRASEADGPLVAEESCFLLSPVSYAGGQSD